MKIWARLGITMDILAEDCEIIFGDDHKAAEERFRQLIRQGKFVPDGDSYIPESGNNPEVSFDV